MPTKLLIIDEMGYLPLDRMEASTSFSGWYPGAIVPGYIMAWKSDHNQRGLAVSQVETVEDKETQHEIARMVEEAEGINNVTVW